MPNGNHGATMQRARHGEPQPAPLTPGAVETEAVPTKRDLASWWKNFKRGSQRREEEKAADAEPQGIFGVPLSQSVRYANVAISLYDNEGKSYIYGYVPIVVAKCGVFLKEKATDVEGIFRLSGSEKRIKELRQAFDSPDRYGKGLNWTGYTVHDAANILRRYFNQLPEPIIPLAFYQRFRDPIRHHQAQAVGEMDGQSPSVGDFDLDAAIKRYQTLITELPPLNRQLLLYILDLLAVFASKSDLNKMTTPNLAAIFQPGILSHPDHDMAPHEYRLSQDVLIFLIENQDHFLIGMQGTAADQKTVQEVESGPPTPQARTGGKLSKTLGRSGSSASKYSGIVRRSVSVSSRQSRGSVAPSPVTTSHSPGTPGSIGVGGVVHRSNTVPSKKSPGIGTGRFPREHPSDPPTPGSARQGYGFVPGAFPADTDSEYLTAHTMHRHPAPPEVISPSSNEGVTSVAPPSGVQAAPPANDSKTQLVHEPEKGKIGPIPIPAPGTNLSPPPGQETPSSARLALSNLLSGKSPPGDTRQPNKLRKKRMPGSANPSANSSQNSLSAPAPEPEGYQASIPASTASNAPLLNAQAPKDHLHPGEQTPVRSASGGPVKPTLSPTGSFRSHSTTTDPDQTIIPADISAAPSQATDSTLGPVDGEQSAEKEKKRRWFSRGNKDAPERDRTASVSGFAPPNPPFAANDTARRSRSSVVSEGGPGRKSVTVDRTVSNAASPESYTSGQQALYPAIPLSDFGHAGERDGRDREKKSPLNWVKGKLAERAEKKEERDRLKEEEKRARSPPGGKEHRRGLSGSMQSLTAQMTGEAGRSGKSMDIPRHTRDEKQLRKSADATREQQQQHDIVPQVVQQQPQPEPKAAVLASEALRGAGGAAS